MRISEPPVNVLGFNKELAPYSTRENEKFKIAWSTANTNPQLRDGEVTTTKNHVRSWFIRDGDATTTNHVRSWFMFAG